LDISKAMKLTDHQINFYRRSGYLKIQNGFSKATVLQLKNDLLAKFRNPAQQKDLTWRELSREVDYEKYGRKIERVLFKLPDETQKDFYIRKENPVVCVLPLTEDQEVILFEQFRPGPKQVFRELPGGYVEPNEDPLIAAKRELLEETGYSGEMQFVTTCSDDAYSTMVRHCYVATNCKKVMNLQANPEEQGNLVFLLLPEFRKLLRSGKMTDVEVGYLGLDYLNLL